LKTLIDLGSSISFDEEELNMIHYLVTTLESVKASIEIPGPRKSSTGILVPKKWSDTACYTYSLKKCFSRKIVLAQH
jgi:hypothetical protein